MRIGISSLGLSRTGSPFPTLTIPVAAISQAAILSLRETMIDIIWSGNGLPSGGVTSKTEDTTDPLASFGLTPINLLRVDTWTVEMDDNDGTPVDTVTYTVWRPSADTFNGRAVLLHRGHSASLSGYGGSGFGEFIRDAVEDGYVVVGCVMPFGEELSGDTVENHNALPSATGTLNYLKFFVEGVIRAANDLITNESVSTVFMCGLSGGGWTTHMVAAMDPRIRMSVAVAGSLPLYMDEAVLPSLSERDWEQNLPSLSSTLDYQDLYIMAASGGRTHWQVLNTGDPSVFSKPWYDAYEPYEYQIEAVARRVAGSFDLIFDENDGHVISDWIRPQILDLFASVLLSAPVNNTAPSIIGDAATGSLLTVNPGAWVEFPTLTYQWKRDGVTVWTGPVYTLAAADIGATITCTVTGTNSLGSTEATSAGVGPVSGTPVFTPASLGVWFDARDLSTMFVERTGESATTPAEVDGPVGSWRNKGTVGGWLTSSTDDKRPILRSYAGRYWLDFDTANDFSAGDATIRAYLANRARAVVSVGFRTYSTPTAQRNVFVWSRSGSVQARAGLYLGLTSNRASVSGRRLDSDSAAIVTGTTAIGAADHVLTGEFLWESATARVYLDGAQDAENTSWQTAGNTSNTNSQLVAVSEGNPVGEAFLYGRVYQIVTDADYSSSPRADVDAFIADMFP